MTLFSWMVILHLIGDILFQTVFEAMNKAKGRLWNRALMSHCLKYTLVFLPMVLLGLLAWPWLAFIFATHAFLDRRWPVIWWRRRVVGDSEEAVKNTFWLTIVVDQIFHLIVLAIICGLGSAL